MSIDIHPILFLPIPPVQLPHPSWCCLQWNGSLLHTEAFLDLWLRNIIHNILGIDVPILGNLEKMELDLLGKVFIIKDRGWECAIVMEWEFLMMEIVVDPGVYVLCMVWTLTLGLQYHHGSLLPSVWELRAHVQIDCTHHGRLAMVQFPNLPNPVQTWFQTWGSGIRFSRIYEPEPLSGFRFEHRPNSNLTSLKPKLWQPKQDISEIYVRQ